MTERARPDLSVVIIAYNEEANLERCLKSIPRGAEIIVLDSESRDRTCAIAQSYGARVYQRPFTNFAEQKNAANGYASSTWILSLDADEELSEELSQAILAIVTFPNPKISGYRLRRSLVFMGRRMRYGKTVDRPLRLFRREHASYHGSIHEELKLNQGKKAKLSEGTIWHYSYRDLSDYFVRFNRYTSAIAEQHAREGRKVPSLLHVLRPWFEFLVRYFLRLGCLDGYPGYTYALISSLYAYIKYAKLVELKGQTHVE